MIYENELGFELQLQFDLLFQYFWFADLKKDYYKVRPESNKHKEVVIT